MSDEKKKVGIYRIRCRKNGKSYVGQSRDIELRFGQHESLCNRGDTSSPLYEDMRKYGIEEFDFEILLQCSPDVTNDELDEYEDRYIRSLKSIEKGYNRRFGGKHGVLTAEQRRKIAQSMLGHECSEETKRKIGKGNERAVICVTTGEIFPSVKAAMQKYGNEPHNQLFCGIKNSRSGLKFERYKEKVKS